LRQVGVIVFRRRRPDPAVPQPGKAKQLPALEHHPERLADPGPLLLLIKTIGGHQAPPPLERLPEGRPGYAMPDCALCTIFSYRLTKFRKQLILDSKPEPKRPMTVCIAAICEHDLIVVASDRMLSAGQVEFEPAPASNDKNFITKITQINAESTIMMLMAGATGFQTEIAKQMLLHIRAAEIQKKKQISVREAVDLYINFYNQEKAKKAANKFLAPLGIDFSAFHERKTEIQDETYYKLIDAMLDYSPQEIETETLITGIDADRSAHLYKLTNNIQSCHDATGFAAIGFGAVHAEFEFMRAGYSRIVPQQEAVWLTYFSKRKAEIAPGVGKMTDIYCLDRKEKKFKVLNELLIEANICALCDECEQNQRSAFMKAQNELKAFLEKKAKEIAEKHQN
jgi:hypothetical protein